MRILAPWHTFIYLAVAATPLACGQPYTISTVVGPVGLPNNVPGKSVSLGANIPQFLTSDAAGNVYFSGPNSVLRLDAVTGLIATIAGGVTAGYSGDNGPAAPSSIVPRGSRSTPPGTFLSPTPGITSSAKFQAESSGGDQSIVATYHGLTTQAGTLITVQ